MGVHVEWLHAGAFVEIVKPEDGWTDPYNQGIDEGSIGLALSNDDLVMIEGTIPELRALVRRIEDALHTIEAE